jgi:sulfite exporter TauE/SafE
MTALVLAVFLASLLGSLHCVGMCGAFLALAFADGPSRGRWRLPLAYHGGRLTTYLLLGVMAGAAGSLLNLGGLLAGVQRVALPLAGGTVLLFGVAGLLRQRGVSVGRLRLPPRWVAVVQRLQSAAMALPPTTRALSVGLLTTLLPCGWLYAFAAVAAGTADPLAGGAVMAVFWLGTLPALVSCGLGVQALAGPLGRRLPTLTCLTLIVIGGWTVAGRGRLDLPSLTTSASAAVVDQPVPTEPACHTVPPPAEFDPVTDLLREDPHLRCGDSRP